MNRHSRLLALALVAVAAPLAAQTATPPAAVTRAAQTITEADVKRRIYIIADDSMQGRDTPSRGLDLTAQYVADQFKSFGLKPGGGNGSYIMRYGVRRVQLDVAASHVGFMANGQHVRVGFDRDAFWRAGDVPSSMLMGQAVVVGGMLAPDSLVASDFSGKIALLVLDYSKPRPATVQPTIDFLRATATAVVIVTNRDSAQFAMIVSQLSGPRTSRYDSVPASKSLAPVVEVQQRAVLAVLGAVGVNLDEIRTSGTMINRQVPALSLMLGAKQDVLMDATAPITVGILEGTDPQLKSEYMVYSAHMDHVGVAGVSNQCRAVGADSICNGADDDGSGTVGVVELAEAFSQKAARTRRSIIFLTVSGEEKGLWGSDYFVSHPTVPLSSIVADINIDMIGRNWPDTIVAIGREHSDLGTTLARVDSMHPELGMVAIDDRWPEENFYFRSDHYNFAKNGVPILFFFNGVHDDYHQVSDSPDKINAEKESRILQLLFYLGQAVANAPQRPQWNPDSYKKIVEGAK
ncbi:MAG: M28 family peptidase [Gemmatimonadales bacterium]